MDSQAGRQIPRRLSRHRRTATAGRTQHLFFRSRHQLFTDHRPWRRRRADDFRRREMATHRREPPETGKRHFEFRQGREDPEIAASYRCRGGIYPALLASQVEGTTVTLEKPIIPTFSMKERDRRWSLLRTAMKKANFDALIALPHEGHWDQFGCDTRYITQIGGTQTEVGCVLPLEADVTAVVRGENEIEWWGLAQDWAKDISPSRPSYGEPTIDPRDAGPHRRTGSALGAAGIHHAQTEAPRLDQH